MPSQQSTYLKHITVQNSPSSERFTSPIPGGGNFKVKPRERAKHGQHLIKQLNTIADISGEIIQSQKDSGINEQGVYVTFDSDYGFHLKVESLDNRRRGIELVSVSTEEKEIEPGKSELRERATVFVREGKLDIFLRKVEDYLSRETNKGIPQNSELVESISSIRLATIEGLWTDNGAFPDPKQRIWWEAWLRVGANDEERNRIAKNFREQANSFQLKLSANQLDFPMSTVMLLYGSANEIAQSVFLINALAELRRAKNTADFFIDMTLREEAEWVKATIISSPTVDAPAVCLLDTGVNNQHPLLNAGLSSDDMHSYNSAWGTADHHGHGTAMAGIALHGDLIELIGSTSPIPLNHKLESVKIFNPATPNQPELYGDITSECVARAEENAPHRNRAICLTVTTTEFRDRGQPSSWSSAVDQICSGANEELKPRRLILVAAGNASFDDRTNYPNTNYTDGIHDPGQSWNAVTVGAYTEKDVIDPDKYPDCIPLAPKGGLCPSSTTSLIWEKMWPLKPDIVFEGGNMAIHPTLFSVPFQHEALELLTTNAKFQNRLLTTTGETSAATALAARSSALIFAEYPHFWPETVRGLLVHSARWTPQMLADDNFSGRSREKEELLRIYGYGVPDTYAALYSASNSLTLVSQNYIQPYIEENGSIKTNEMHLHELPWPANELSKMGGVEFEMRVSLSYFIEPNPARRGFRSKYRYMSHGLRFDTKSPTESVDDFRRQINQMARNEDKTFRTLSNRHDGWLLGPKIRTRGSLHSDTWYGDATALAEKGVIAIYPVSGWWKESKQHEKWNSIARYSLIVTIRTPVNVDVYTPVANLILV